MLIFFRIYITDLQPTTLVDYNWLGTVTQKINFPNVGSLHLSQIDFMPGRSLDNY